MDAFLTTRMWKAKERVIDLFKEESGETNIIAIILVVVVVIALVALLQDQLKDLVNKIFGSIFGDLGLEHTDPTFDENMLND